MKKLSYLIGLHCVNIILQKLIDYLLILFFDAFHSGKKQFHNKEKKMLLSAQELNLKEKNEG
jgi:hypothetical protein